VFHGGTVLTREDIEESLLLDESEMSNFAQLDLLPEYNMRMYRTTSQRSVVEQFDICNALDDTEFCGRSEAETPNVVANPVLKPLRRLANIFQELIATETAFVADMSRLLSLLNEWKFCTRHRVKNFVHSGGYIGIRAAVETISRSNSLFLSLMNMAVQDQEEDPDPDDISSLVYFVKPICSGIFKAFLMFSPIFPLYSQYFIYHDEFTSLYSSAYKESPSFRDFMKQNEVTLGCESILSLVIKPVQRLPRYVLLCRELADALQKCVMMDASSSLSTYDFQSLTSLHGQSQDVLRKISECVQQCNALVQEHQDTTRLHELHGKFAEGGTDMNAHKIVEKGRGIVREGNLRRHHKHGGVKTHRVILFSDALVSSSMHGRGLWLEQFIALTRHSDTMCCPIPNPYKEDDSTWFVVISSSKRLYFSADSHEDMRHWVDAIHTILQKNEGQSDFYLMRHQVGIVNIMISEINLRKTEVEKLLEGADDDSTSECTTRARQSSHAFAMAYEKYSKAIQACWWHLVDLLDSPFLSPEACKALEESRMGSVSPEEAPRARTDNLARVIEHHCNEVVERIVLSIQCVPEDTLEDGRGQVEALLMGDGSPRHYLVAIGVFLEYPSEFVGSMETGERPLLLKLFLLHDVLIGAHIDKINNNLRYAFHIHVCNLECTDYRDGVGDMAIVVADTSTATAKHSGKKKGLKPRLLYAPTVELKFDWLALMMQTCEEYKRSVASAAQYTICTDVATSAGTDGGFQSPTALLRTIPLQQLSPHINGTAWAPKSTATHNHHF
jgi:hypothetical protein